MTRVPHIAYVALGSNLNQPKRQIVTAIAHIDDLPNTRVSNRASLYQSTPMGPQDQPDFINTVIAVETSLTPEKLLQGLLDIEQKMGRIRTRHWGERVIDLDLIAMDDLTCHSDLLTLPHPHAREREFVIVPLAEIAPEFVIIGQGQVSVLAKAFSGHAMCAVD